VTLSHLDARGRASMVDVGAKGETERLAVARGVICLASATLDLIAQGGLPKGDVVAVARLAGIQAAKQTAQLIPLCHPLALTHVAVDVAVDRPAGAVAVTATVRTRGRTGVEMEALTAVTVALLAVYDMVKAEDRGAVIDAVQLIEKRGGAHGDWRRSEEP
jgi:cyclic pyranopterin monophosphate synthase